MTGGPRAGGAAWIVLAVLLVLAAAAGAWWWLAGRDPGPGPAAEEFAAAWDAGDPGRGPVLGDPSRVRASYGSLVEGLDLDAPAVSLASVPEPVDGRATAELSVRWALGGDRTWSYDTTADLVRGEEGWEVDFSPRVVHPELDHGLRLVTRRTAPDRADVLGADGTPLVTDREIVRVGVHPARVEDLDALVATLADMLDVDGDGLRERIGAASDDAFVPVITLRAEAYADLEDELHPLPGTVFQRGELPLAPSAEFARPVLGRAGPVTAELLEEHPERYAAGDVVGLSGLQRRYDEQLFGLPGLQVVAVPTEDDRDADEQVLHEVAAVDREPVTVTLDEDVQRAAEDALDDIELPSALVAIRVEDGHVLAAANGPGTRGQEIAAQGRFAPGSTFKVVTTAALLAGGLDPDDDVPCEGDATVGGRRFTNAEDADRGTVPFTQAFAQSCNTTFVTLAQDLGTDRLPEAAGWFGLGGDHRLGIDTFAGQVPEPEDAVDQAATAIGQGRVLASPLAMADVAATVARGAHLVPQLVLQPDPEEATEPRPLPSDVDVEALRALMRRVVTDGSGSAVRDVPGGPVHGKTGSAEYGTETPPRTHAWFIGYQGGLAFAVLVAETDGGSGGRLAAPVAADFLTRVAG